MIVFGAGVGPGAINFNHTSSGYIFCDGPISGNAGGVNQLAGNTILTAANTYNGTDLSSRAVS